LLVPVGKARLKTYSSVAARAGYSCGLAALLIVGGARALQNAVAEGDTRTISMHHIHTDEDITITFKRDGQYDEAALEKLNWFLRDWRRSQETRMDPHLIDLLWEVQRETGSKEPIWVVCGYRSPETNAMLRRRSAGVARFSQHMLGHATDFYIPGVPLEQLRVIGLRLQRGGVGFYPTSGSPFVHMDTGGVRHWPRMTREQLVKVFPDGRTVHIPTDGRPLAGYALALADIKKRGGNPSAMSVDAARSAGINVEVADAADGERHGGNPFAKLLGLGHHDEEEEDAAQGTSAEAPATAAATPLRTRAKAAVAAAVNRVEDKIARAEDKLAAEKAKLVKVASKVHVITRAEAAPLAADAAAPNAATTPNQVITARGYWQGLPDGMTAAKPAAASAAAPQSRTELASADPDATGAVGAFAAAREDRVPTELALAYAELPQGSAKGSVQGSVQASAEGIAQLRAAAAALPRAAAGDNGTTVAVKRVGGRPASAVFTVANRKSSALADADQLADPWLRAIFLSPSVRGYLTTLALGSRDFTALAPLMAKPDSSVMMTFSSDPNPGLEPDHFSGSAIVFISTVSYPTHTADLR
jgi:uncharacterized protein YcbK (DUF882 family)